MKDKYTGEIENMITSVHTYIVILKPTKVNNIQRENFVGQRNEINRNNGNTPNRSITTQTQMSNKEIIIETVEVGKEVQF